MGEFLTDWIRGARLDREPTTWHGYRRAAENHIIPKLGRLRLRDLTPERIQAYYVDRLERGRMSDGGPLAPKTVRMDHVVLRRALEDGVRGRLIETNPAAEVTPPRLPRRDATEGTWTPDQLTEFLEATREHFFYPAFLLLATTGVRREELLGLRWQDVDFETGRIQVRFKNTMDDGRIYLAPRTKSASSNRAIELDPVTLGVLRSHRKRQVAWRLAAGPSWADEHGLCFTWEDGRPIRSDYFSRELTRTVRKLGLPHMTPHSLRHTHATHLIAAGVHPKVVQERLGHSSSVTTMDLYGSALPSLQRQAVEQLAEALGLERLVGDADDAEADE